MTAGPIPEAVPEAAADRLRGARVLPLLHPLRVPFPQVAATAEPTPASSATRVPKFPWVRCRDCSCLRSCVTPWLPWRRSRSLCHCDRGCRASLCRHKFPERPLRVFCLRAAAKTAPSSAAATAYPTPAKSATTATPSTSTAVPVPAARKFALLPAVPYLQQAAGSKQQAAKVPRAKSQVPSLKFPVPVQSLKFQVPRAKSQVPSRLRL